MGFEAPFALLGLLLAGAPIAIHLIKRRDLRTYVLPTVALLREAQAESRQRLRLADLLLLLLRVLALALLLACIARPYSLSTVTASGDTALALAIVLDDSASMAARRGGERVFDAARAHANEALDQLPVGSEVTVILAGSPPSLAVPRTSDIDYVRAELARLGPGATRADLPAALQLARRELSGADSRDLRILLLSDIRHDDMPESGLPEPGGMTVDSVTLTPDPGPNLALREVLVTPSYDTPDELMVQLSVVRTPTESEPEPGRATAPVAYRAAVTSMSGAPLAAAEGSVDAASATVRLRLPRPDPEDSLVYVTIESDDDVLDADNRRIVDLAGRPVARVGVVNGSPHPSPHLDEVTFLRAALEAVASAGLTLNIAMLDASTIERGALDTLDVVVLANVAALTATQGARLEAFARDGGGVLITAGDQIQVASYAAALPRCMPGRLEPASPVASGTLTGESRFTSLPEPGVQQRLAIAPLELDAVALLRFPDGSPALAGRAVGTGRCAVLTTTVDLAWGDLALAPEFVALVQETLTWLLGARRPTAPPPAGEPVQLALPSTPVTAVVTTPDGQALPVPATGVFRATRLAGRYAVELDGQASERLSFTVEVEPVESDLRAAPHRAGTGDRAHAGSTAGRRRSWVPGLLGLAALLLAAEGVLRSRTVAALRGR